MAYGTKYTILFKSRTGELLTFNIQARDYTGVVVELLGAMPAVVLRKDQDDPFEPYQATTCEVTYINELNVPLSTFFTEDDRYWRGSLEKRDGTVIWQGFLILDDCEEAFTSAPYRVRLQFTDGLAEAKQLPFNEAADASGHTDFAEREAVISSGVLTITDFLFDPELEAGDTIIINDGPYTVDSYSWSTSNILTINVSGFTRNGIYTVQVRYRNNYLTKITLLSFIRILLNSTGLTELPLRVFSGLYEVDTDDSTDRNCFEQTRVFAGMYLSDDGQWDDMYAIVEDILRRFNCVLVQAGGYWNIIRWTEAFRYTDGDIQGMEYDADYSARAATTLAPLYEDSELIQADAIAKITRAYSITKETFNYEQPKELIRNINLQELGTLLSTTTDGDGNTVKDYEAPYWFETNLGGYNPGIYIRVITSPDGQEVDRYLVIDGAIFGGPYVRSSKMYMQVNDRINVSYEVRTSDSQTGSISLTQEYRVVGGSTIKMRWNVSDPDGSWGATGGVQIEVDASQNTENWFAFATESLGVTVDGYFDIGLGQLDANGTINETHYKNFRIEYIPYIEDGRRVIGHYHEQENDNDARTKYDETIVMDDSPRQSIAGSLFTNEVTAGEYNTLTAGWKLRDFIGGGPGARLGEIVTYERAGLRSRARKRIEGTFALPDIDINMASLLFLSDKYLILGNTTIDYSNATMTSEVHEVYADGETEFTDLVYTFDYLYQIT